MKQAKDKSPTGERAALLPASLPTYLQVAGTNIEDLDRALKSSGWRAACEQDTDTSLPQ